MTEVRKSIFPSPDDTWQSIAERELGAGDEHLANLQSWNLHVFARPKPPESSPRAGNQILPSDVIFIEAPLAS